ncbi:acylphosphatase-2-like [Centruroides vittatus]|uniref:acylphosphatase-2-like n=1 Tax=Centruroides vittatus TaxID=120091 RepID=UPI0035105D7D
MAPAKEPKGPTLVEVEFEVEGDVHGVSFTKYAKDMCHNLGLTGWIRLSSWGTIVGQLQGETYNVNQMTTWLQKHGSPGSRIKKCDLRNWQVIDSCTYRNFSVRF